MHDYPDYPRNLGATVAKFRRMASRGLKSLTPEQRHAYGEAVGKAILAKQRTEGRRAGEVMPEPRCASGTWHNTAEAIHAAVLQQQRTALLNCPGNIRRKRTEYEWESLYNEAMAAKRSQQKDKAA